MKFRKVTAIIPSLSLDDVEKELIALGVPGMTVTKAHGLGEYRNYYAKDSMSDCSRVEVFIEAEKAKQIANTIAKAVHQGMSTDGIIAILPVEELIHIREFHETNNDG